MTTHFGEFTIWPSGEMYMTTGTRRKATAAAPIPDVVEHIKQQIIETVGEDLLQIERGRGGTITLKYEAEIAGEAPAGETVVDLADGAVAELEVQSPTSEPEPLPATACFEDDVPWMAISTEESREVLRKQGIYPY